MFLNCAEIAISVGGHKINISWCPSTTTQILLQTVFDFVNVYRQNQSHDHKRNELRTAPSYGLSNHISSDRFLSFVHRLSFLWGSIANPAQVFDNCPFFHIFYLVFSTCVFSLLVRSKPWCFWRQFRTVSRIFLDSLWDSLDGGQTAAMPVSTEKEREKWAFASSGIRSHKPFISGPLTSRSQLLSNVLFLVWME